MSRSCQWSSDTPPLYAYIGPLPRLDIEGVLDAHRELALFARSRGFTLVDLVVEPLTRGT